MSRFPFTAKRPPASFKIADGLNAGKPVVILDFGRLGRIVLDGDDVERLKAQLDAKLAAAAARGTT
jgi:hypothetical protein